MSKRIFLIISVVVLFGCLLTVVITIINKSNESQQAVDALRIHVKGGFSFERPLGATVFRVGDSGLEGGNPDEVLVSMMIQNKTYPDLFVDISPTGYMIAYDIPIYQTAYSTPQHGIASKIVFNKSAQAASLDSVSLSIQAKMDGKFVTVTKNISNNIIKDIDARYSKTSQGGQERYKVFKDELWDYIQKHGMNDFVDDINQLSRIVDSVIVE